VQTPALNHEQHYAPAQQCGPEQAEGVLDQREVEDVEAEPGVLGSEACELEILLEVPAAGHGLDPEAEGEQDVALHGQDVLEGELSAADVVVLLELGSLDFLVLGRHEQRGNAEQLVASAGDVPAVAVLVEDEDCKVESVVVAAQRVVHLHQPPHQHLPHRRSYLRVPPQEVVGNVALVLLGSRVLLDLGEVGVDLGQGVQPFGRQRRLPLLGS
jgi:hypothetical protein